MNLLIYSLAVVLVAAWSVGMLCLAVATFRLLFCKAEQIDKLSIPDSDFGMVFGTLLGIVGGVALIGSQAMMHAVGVVAFGWQLFFMTENDRRTKMSQKTSLRLISDFIENLVDKIGE